MGPGRPHKNDSNAGQGSNTPRDLETLRKKRVIRCNTACQRGDREQCPLDAPLNPNTLMQLDVFCKQLIALPLRAEFLPSQCIWGRDTDVVVRDLETLRKKRVIRCNTAWPQCQPEDRVKCPLDGSLNPNTLMQLDVFCKQSFATPSRVSASQRIWGLDADGVLTDTEALRKKRPIICNTAWPQCQPEDRIRETLRKKRRILSNTAGPNDNQGTEAKYPLDRTLNPNTLMQLDRYTSSLASSANEGQEKDPLDGTLNPNTLMQLDRFCKQLDRFCNRKVNQETLRKNRLIFCNTAWPDNNQGTGLTTLDGTLNPNTLMQLDLFLQADRVVKDPETLRKKRRILSNTAWPQ
ncbi:Natural cytotoxicity triggering receptor 3 ligand 1 [Manis javanica]|nr:Natural cytotoxicity triggering receptor 3 ligand 1 [Manis javanica]